MTDLSGNFEYDCQEELNRKTFEALDMIDSQFQSGRMSESAYRGALEGINLCVRGLVPEQYVLALDQEISLLAPKDRRTSVWASEAAVYVISQIVGDDYFVVRTVPAGEGKKVVKGEGLDPVKSAADKFRQFEKKLQANNYKQL